MAEPINWKSKITLVKTETTYGVDPTATGAANGMLLTDVQIQPMEGDDVSRNLELPHLGAQDVMPVGLRVVFTASFELVGSGSAGVAPAWGPLLRACAAAEVITAGNAVEYSPVSEGHESVWISFFIGSTLHAIKGARGTGVITLNAQGIPVCRVTMTGLFIRPVEAARPVPDFSRWQEPSPATMVNTPGFTVAGIPFVLRSFELNLGNDVQPRLLVGVERIMIVDRNESLTATVEAVPMTTYNPYQRAEERTRANVVLDHGKAVGKRVQVSAPQAVQRRLSGLEQNQNIVEWPLAFTPLPTDAGNDQWLIRCT
jgi:hypothetical protein